MKRESSISLGILAGMLLLICALGCDSPPWSQVIVVNATNSELNLRYKVPASSLFVHPCIYSAEQWKTGERYCEEKSHIWEISYYGDKWVEETIPPGGAVEIDRGPYPQIQEDPEGNVLVDRLELNGSQGVRMWEGRTAILREFTKEGSDFSWLRGRSPRFVYYYR